LQQIRVFGLSRLETLDLKKQFPEAEITFESAGSDVHQAELVTAALVGVSLIGLQALAAWLMKNREQERIEKTIEVVQPDGTRRKERFTFQMSKSTGQADVVKALAEMTNVDVSTLLQTE
jgi:hypothetical protein